MYTHNYCKKIFTSYKKNYHYIKKILLLETIIKKNSFKYKNGKPRAKFIIK